MSDDSSQAKLFGKYRGTVVNNVDYKREGRLTIQVPAIGGGLVVYAEPCFPFAGLPGMASGMFFTPPIGSGVFVEFLNGDIEQPIWSGGYPGSVASMPIDASAQAPGLEPLVFQSGVLKITVANNLIEIGLAGAPRSSMANGIQIQPGMITFMVGAARFTLTPAGMDMNSALQIVPGG